MPYYIQIVGRPGTGSVPSTIAPDKDAAHRNVIKFCFDLGMTPVETQKKLQLTEDHRHKRFEDGWTDCLNGKSGRPREINASTVDNVNERQETDSARSW